MCMYVHAYAGVFMCEHESVYVHMHVCVLGEDYGLILS